MVVRPDSVGSMGRPKPRIRRRVLVDHLSTVELLDTIRKKVDETALPRGRIALNGYVDVDPRPARVSSSSS
jgi:hypothetical protein